MAAQPSTSLEECCICALEFTNITDLAAHLIRHAEDSAYQESLVDNGILYEKPVSSAPNPSKRTYAEYITTTFCQIQNLNKPVPKRSKSPIVLDIGSDSDDEPAKKATPVPVPQPVPMPSIQNSKRSRPSTQCSTNSVVNQQNSNDPISLPETKPPYTCRVCNKTFDDPKLFRDHLLTHEKPRPFPCHICKKTFAYRGTLRQHLRMHIGDKLHQCPKCTKRFTIKDVLRKHCEEVHKLVLN